MEEYAAEKSAKQSRKILAIIVAVLILFVAFGIVYSAVIIPKQKYSKAVELIGAGEYAEAYALLEEIGDIETINSSKYSRAEELLNTGKYAEAQNAFLELGDYTDSSEKAKASYSAILKSYQVGDIIKFGTYEQDNFISAGKEDIEWIVLAKDGDKALIISRYSLDCLKYNDSRTDVTWETCTLRTWLNGTFYDAAFSFAEQEMIASTNVTADRNIKYGTNSGSDTTDKVFLLSIPEAGKYFSSIESRSAVATQYAVAQGAYKGGNGNSIWWLRSPGRSSSVAAFVCNAGYVRSDGYVVIYSLGTVRPALWIDPDL